MTRKAYKRLKAKEGTNSTPGLSKSENCKATALDKAMAKYPRSYRTMPHLYISFNVKKDKTANRTTGFFADLIKK